MGLLSFGDVACDLGIAKKPSLIVANGIDDDMGPKASPVLADAPPFAFRPALAPEKVERLLRLARFAVFTTIGSIPWIVGLGVLGREVGASWQI